MEDFDISDAESDHISEAFEHSDTESAKPTGMPRMVISLR